MPSMVNKGIDMKASDIIQYKDRHKGRIIAIHFGGFNGRKIPEELKPFIAKHVKTSKNGNKYVNQYNDEWYWNVFGDNMGIHDFNSFWKVIKPYFTIQTTKQK